MKLLVAVIVKREKFEELLEALIEIGTPGITILDSVGAIDYLKEEVPIFAGFRALFDGKTAFSKTIFSVIPDEMEEGVLNEIEKVLGDLGKPDTGIAFTLPVSKVRGLRK